MTSLIAVNNYAISAGTSSTNGFITFLSTRAPTVNDTNYPIQKRWVNTLTSEEYILIGFNSFSGISTAIWLPLGVPGGGGSVTNYTNVTSGMSPYTVLTTDNYISVDCSGGAVTLNFPNSPISEQAWIVKDRTGNAATHHITLTTTGGTLTFDGATSYVMSTNYQAVDLLSNGTTIEVF